MLPPPPPPSRGRYGHLRSDEHQNTTPDFARPRLTPTRDEPTRRFERGLALALFLFAAALLLRAFL